MLLITCGLHCHNNALDDIKARQQQPSSEEQKKKSFRSWYSDNPSNPEKCSMHILIEWLTQSGNYSC
jgi:hypothetical protein